MFQVYSGVKVTNPDNKLASNAGCIVGIPAKDDGVYKVRMDADNAVYEVPAADLEGL